MKHKLLISIFITSIVLYAMTTGYSIHGINGVFEGTIRSGMKQKIVYKLFDYIEEDSDLKGYKLISEISGEIESSFTFSNLKTKNDLISLFKNEMNLEVIEDTENKIIKVFEKQNDITRESTE